MQKKVKTIILVVLVVAVNYVLLSSALGGRIWVLAGNRDGTSFECKKLKETPESMKLETEREYNLSNCQLKELGDWFALDCALPAKIYFTKSKDTCIEAVETGRLPSS